MLRTCVPVKLLWSNSLIGHHNRGILSLVRIYDFVTVQGSTQLFVVGCEREMILCSSCAHWARLFARPQFTCWCFPFETGSAQINYTLQPDSSVSYNVTYISIFLRSLFTSHGVFPNIESLLRKCKPKQKVCKKNIPVRWLQSPF